MESNSNNLQHDNSHLSSTKNKTIKMKKCSAFGLDQFNNTNELSDLLTNSKVNEHHHDVVFYDNSRWAKLIFERIPKIVVANIVKLMITVGDEGITIENLKFIYNAVYLTSLDSTIYGFTTDLKMFNLLKNWFLRIRYGVLFRKTDKFNWQKYFENIQVNENEYAKQNLICSILKSTPDISVNIESTTQMALQKQHAVLMGEAYNPSLFYLKGKEENHLLNELMEYMLTCYEEENSKYCVPPEHIIPGLFFVYSYKTHHTIIQWRRIRILKEVDQMSVEVFHVDFGLVKIIPKTEIRYLKLEFSLLPCIAFHCCLTGYNQIDVIPSEVTSAFFKITFNKNFNVFIDQVKIIKYKNYKYKVYFVTLYNTSPTALYTEINEELTYKYAEYKAAENYNKYKELRKDRDSDSSS